MGDVGQVSDRPQGSVLIRRNRAARPVRTVRHLIALGAVVMGLSGSVLPPGFSYLEPQIASTTETGAVIEVSPTSVSCAPCEHVWLSVVYTGVYLTPTVFSVLLQGPSFLVHEPDYDQTGPCIYGDFTNQGPNAVLWAGSVVCKAPGAVRTRFAVDPSIQDGVYPLTITFGDGRWSATCFLTVKSRHLWLPVVSRRT